LNGVSKAINAQQKLNLRELTRSYI